MNYGCVYALLKPRPSPNTHTSTHVFRYWAKKHTAPSWWVITSVGSLLHQWVTFLPGSPQWTLTKKMNNIWTWKLSTRRGGIERVKMNMLFDGLLHPCMSEETNSTARHKGPVQPSVLSPQVTKVIWKMSSACRNMSQDASHMYVQMRLYVKGCKAQAGARGPRWDMDFKHT